MNKPKWLELIWLALWMMPPVILAAIIGGHFGLNFIAYFFLSLVSLSFWLGTVLVWCWLTSARNEGTRIDKNDG